MSGVHIPHVVKIRMAAQRREIAAARQAQQLSVVASELSLPVQFLTAEAASEFASKYGLTHLTPTWFKKQCERKRIPYAIAGRRRVIRQDYLLKMLENWTIDAS